MKLPEGWILESPEYLEGLPDTAMHLCLNGEAVATAIGPERAMGRDVWSIEGRAKKGRNGNGLWVEIGEARTRADAIRAFIRVHFAISDSRNYQRPFTEGAK